ncbi:hypothetical protein QQS21_003758 [Conoideocrella luteorostrata]|uniref:Rad4-domain-containing protein n=1 Tax=Conoideocrella luteorostrata TaxID=1105319 RepID=A0AAJ0CSM1_9HYPO|nr:hypothetical protein QQS21_003758 [Conoideocrella luteorostrata]
MPPHVPRKRLRGSPGSDSGKAEKIDKDASSLSSNKRKPTLYDDLDATATPLSAQSAGSIFQTLDDDESSSSLTSLSDEDFEGVPQAKRLKVAREVPENEDEDEDFEFEDVAAPAPFESNVPAVSGDLELTLNKDTRMSLTNVFGDKKGPSKRERKVRNATHCMHVLTLLWHNAVRNSWLCDPEVQAIMISHLPPKMWDEVERWRLNSGLIRQPVRSEKTTAKSRSGTKGKGRQRESRDWGSTAKRLEEGVVDMSHGDPLFRLMQSLTSWWKQRFKVNASGLRKWGYMALERLDRLTKAYKENFEDQSRFGERVASLEDFRRCAVTCQGSRDIGAQLFAALLRGLCIEARLVASLQPLGFGWNRLEDAEPEKEDKQGIISHNREAAKTSSKSTPSKKSSKQPPVTSNSKPRRAGRSKMLLESLSSNEDKLQPEYTDTDDESVVNMEITPKKPASNPRKFDLDLEYPHYWTEVFSPVTHKYLPVDPIVKGSVATNRDIVETFGPRGQRADKARQVMAYIVGYSPDGTAKDVTVRYVKRQVLPGRTKGVRMPVEKIPVYNRHGKVKRYEEFDWFKTAMSGYRRGTKVHPITEIDDNEDLTDLKPGKPEKREIKEGEETLQYYKQSQEFVLKRHLKREEALKSEAAPVKKFKNKAKGGNTEEDDVYLRSDVVQVKSAETWHKQGRAPLAGVQPLKRVPYRAATTNRRREIIEAEAATGEKVLQGLYSYEQTDWIIPPPIKNGVIPKNGYGNIDLFAEHMCPEGAVHVPFRGVMKVCKRLKIDYAEAVVDFEFGHRMAVPVIQGVVIAEEYHDQVMTELEKDEAERRRKEDEKRRKAALGKWRRFIMGLRIVERIRQEYGEINDSVSVFGHGKAVGTNANAPAAEEDEEMAGGFLPEGYEEEGQQHGTSSFFPVVDDEGDENQDDQGLTIEHG